MKEYKNMWGRVGGAFLVTRFWTKLLVGSPSADPAHGAARQAPVDEASPPARLAGQGQGAAIAEGEDAAAGRSKLERDSQSMV
jgi:hypothetical protein